ncbi:MAG: hypothetical protein KBI01_06020 [Oscillospiraceae bacterium]|nr:hypothetical protein [Oscillospiraceae bacterium]
MYFNYHAKAKQLIVEGHLTEYEILERYNNISPCLLLYFDNNRPLPIREHKWEEYFLLINKKTTKTKESSQF